MQKDWLNSQQIKEHSRDMRQFIDFRETTLANGMRTIDVYNSSGLHFTLLPDRGLDIWAASYNGRPLTWIAPGSPHPPDYGQSWLSLFNGGLLTTCGLTHVGPPEDGRDIHGNYTRLRARNIHVVADWDATQTSWHSTLMGTIQQTPLFGEQFTLTRQIQITLGQPEIQLTDSITNHGDEATPLMLLYHCNLGYPLIAEGAQLMTASTVYPRDTAAQQGAATWSTYAAPQPGYAEQVFLHHVKQMNGQAQAAILNADFGLKFTWSTATMPYLTQWKNTRQGSYICGIEPGNCIPEGQNAARASGRLVMLQPGQTQTFGLTLSILDGAEAVQKCRETIQQLDAEGIPVSTCDLHGY